MSVDVEAMVSRFLRAHPGVVALVEDRVYTDLPHERTYPMVMLQRTGGGPLFNNPPDWLVEAEMTLDFYGTSHKSAHIVANTCMNALLHEMRGAQEEGVVTVVRGPVTTYLPDEDFVDEAGHARPRFQVQVNVVTHPH